MTVWPWARISTTIARRSRIGSFDDRLTPYSLRPSSMLTARMNTLGRRPTTTSKIRIWRRFAYRRSTRRLPGQRRETSHRVPFPGPSDAGGVCASHRAVARVRRLSL